MALQGTVPNEDLRTITQPEEVAQVVLSLSCGGSAAIDVAWKGQDILPTVPETP